MTENNYHHGDLKNALVRAGIEILAEDGIKGLSLRKAARRAGVSHSAPYAHFTDKQALIAAISTDGYQKIYDRMMDIAKRFPGDPLRQFIETAWAYVQFGFEEPDHFKVTFSGSVEREREYSALVEMTGKTFGLLRSLISRCQDAGVLKPGETDLAALSAWGLIHGFVNLVQQGMVSHTILERFTLRHLMILALNRLLVQPVSVDPADGTPLVETG